MDFYDAVGKREATRLQGYQAATKLLEHAKARRSRIRGRPFKCAMYCYLDQNALIHLFQKGAGAVSRWAASRDVLFVVSPWHLVEIANVQNPSDMDKAMALADFVDQAANVWLLERRDLQRLDVADDFCTFARLPPPRSPRLVTRRGALASLNREPEGAKFDLPSRDFVRRWIEKPRLLEPFRLSCAENVKALDRLREERSDPRLPAAAEIAGRQLIEYSMPSHTPAGLEIGAACRSQYLAQADPNAIPSVALEIAISDASRRSLGKNDRNTLIDKFHLMSLPYVDKLITDDKFFRDAYHACQKTGFVKAKLFRVEAFWQ